MSRQCPSPQLRACPQFHNGGHIFWSNEMWRFVLALCLLHLVNMWWSDYEILDDRGTGVVTFYLIRGNVTGQKTIAALVSGIAYQLCSTNKLCISCEFTLPLKLYCLRDKRVCGMCIYNVFILEQIIQKRKRFNLETHLALSLIHI